MNYSKETIEDLKKRFGLPLYVFDEKGFEENYNHLYSSMKAKYNNYKVAYSFKTNYTPYICAKAEALGAYAEVVSGMEYTIAKRIGFDDNKIIFNGPDKGEEGIRAFLNGCIVNADSLDELGLYCEAAKAHPEKFFKIGIRLNLNIGQDFISRFGMAEGDAERAFQMVAEVQNLKIAGLHCHISRCRSKEAWRKRTVYMLELSDRLFKNDSQDYIDLGSGMFGSMAPEFRAQFTDVPTYEDYAEVTADLISNHFEGREQPIFFTEPGTTLINRFVDCIAEVEAIKSINDHYFAILDASQHTLGETCLLKKLPIEVIPRGAQQAEYTQIDLTGNTCLEQDVLYRDFCGRLAKGDYVVFGNTGGYSNVLKPPFIWPSCAMIAVREGGAALKIKAAETYEELLSTYLFECI